jgi:chloramphenicol-sensitive protein RarD
MIDGEHMNNNIAGTLYALAAFIAWGLLPAYWKLLKQVPSPEILCHRIFWSFVFVSLVLLVKGQWGKIVRTLSVKRHCLAILLSTLLISVNWFVYIWAVNANHMVEASMGYYINPLFCVFLGVSVLRERVSFWQGIAFALALAGVLIMTVTYGRVPWIALSLTLTFGLYGLSKKLVTVDSLTALGLETMFVTPLCLLYLGNKHVQGTGAFGMISLSITMLLLFSGVVTALPLLWFAQATKKIPLSKVGFIQYVAPTLALLLGVFVYKEPFTRVHLLSFGCIWCALALYSLSNTALLKHVRPGGERI